MFDKALYWKNRKGNKRGQGEDASKILEKQQGDERFALGQNMRKISN